MRSGGGVGVSFLRPGDNDSLIRRALNLIDRLQRRVSGVESDLTAHGASSYPHAGHVRSPDSSTTILQAGQQSATTSASGLLVALTFTEAFSSAPYVVPTVVGTGGDHWTAQVHSTTTTTARFRVFKNGSQANTEAVVVDWIAVGPA